VLSSASWIASALQAERQRPGPEAQPFEQVTPLWVRTVSNSLRTPSARGSGVRWPRFEAADRPLPGELRRTDGSQCDFSSRHVRSRLARDDYDAASKPQICWGSAAERAALVAELFADAQLVLAACPGWTTPSWSPLLRCWPPWRARTSTTRATGR
jgi:hypothetical protein